LLVQVGAISLGALRIPLWPHAPAAGEFLTLEILLIVQLLFAALLSPRLCQDWRTSAMAIASAWPFAMLAGNLSAVTTSISLHAALYVNGWIAVLWIWNLAFCSNRGRMQVSAMASAWLAAGPLLLFIGNEYAATPFHSSGIVTRAMLGPMIDALTLIGSNGPETAPTRAACAWLSCAAILGIAVLMLKRWEFQSVLTGIFHRSDAAQAPDCKNDT